MATSAGINSSVSISKKKYLGAKQMVSKQSFQDFVTDKNLNQSNNSSMVFPIYEARKSHGQIDHNVSKMYQKQFKSRKNTILSQERPKSFVERSAVLSSIKSSSTVGAPRWQSMVGDAAAISKTFKNFEAKQSSSGDNSRLNLNKKYHDWVNKYETAQEFTGSHKTEIKTQVPFNDITGAKQFINQCNQKPKRELSRQNSSNQVKSKQKSSIYKIGENTTKVFSKKIHNLVNLDMSQCQKFQYIDGHKNVQYKSPTNMSSGVGCLLKSPASGKTTMRGEILKSRESSRSISPFLQSHADQRSVRATDLYQTFAKARTPRELTSQRSQSNTVLSAHDMYINNRKNIGPMNSRDAKSVMAISQNLEVVQQQKESHSQIPTERGNRVSFNFQNQQTQGAGRCQTTINKEKSGRYESNTIQTRVGKGNGSPLRSNEFKFYTEPTSEIQNRVAEKILERNWQFQDKNHNNPASILNQFTGDCIEQAYRTRSQSREYAKNAAQISFLKQSVVKPSNLDSKGTLNHVQFEEKQKDRQPIEHTIGLSNQYRQAQQYLIGHNLREGLVSQINSNQTQNETKKENQKQFERNIIMADIQKEIEQLESEHIRKICIKKELIKFYKSNSKACYNYKDTQQKLDKRLMADTLKQKLILDRRKSQINMSGYDDGLMDNKQSSNGDQFHIMSSLNLGLDKPQE